MNGVSENLQSLFDEAKKLQINFADSIPAFEIWFLLHYEMPKHFYENQDEAIKDLQKHIIGYSKEQKWLSCANLYSRLKSHLENAIGNSEKLEKTNREQHSEQSTQCNVYKLFADIEKIKW